ncbi:MAG: hypothetical protein Q9165_007780 [Trypethelium subeluteriae]
MSPRRDWCGTKPSGNLNEADQAPPPRTMPAFPEGEKHYECITQDGFMPTWGKAEVAEVAQDNRFDEIVVGAGPIIPRWSGTAANPANLLYFGVSQGFPSNADFDYAVKSFQAAADDWNAINFGVTINRTTDRAKANFVLVYYKPSRDSFDKGTVARAFFPNKVDDVRCYDLALTDPEERKYLKNTFLHEIGHIIGLRHEFAIKADEQGNGPEGMGAIQFGSENKHSVMSYDAVNYMQDTDKHDVVEFYKLPNRFNINGVEITDFIPKPLPVQL